MRVLTARQDPGLCAAVQEHTCLWVGSCFPRSLSAHLDVRVGHAGTSTGVATSPGPGAYHSPGAGTPLEVAVRKGVPRPKTSKTGAGGLPKAIQYLDNVSRKRNDGTREAAPRAAFGSSVRKSKRPAGAWGHASFVRGAHAPSPLTYSTYWEPGVGTTPSQMAWQRHLRL